MYRLPRVRVALVREGTVTAETRTIRGPEDAAAILHELIGDADRETLAVLLLDVRHRVLGCHIAAVGVADSAPVHPRETFRAAILAGAQAVLVGHNHPSGDPKPSPADMAITRRLAQAGDMIGIRVLDHVIIGAGRWVSLASRGGLRRDGRPS